MKSSRGVAELGILCLHLSWGLDARGYCLGGNGGCSPPKILQNAQPVGIIQKHFFRKERVFHDKIR